LKHWLTPYLKEETRDDKTQDEKTVKTEKPKVPEKVEESVFVNTASFASLL
jgi:hypothetical protein